MSYSISMFRVLSVSAALLAVPAAHANLLSNGSFESGAFVDQGNDTMSLPSGSVVITGWTVVTDTTAWIGPMNTFGLTASDGVYFLDLADYQTGEPFAGVRQTITTVPGATYALSFDLGGSNRYGRPDAITASAAGTAMTFTTPDTGTSNDWYRESMQFVATSTSTVVSLQGAAGIDYVGLDNAAVELISLPVPEPKAWALFAAGLAAFGAVARCRRA
jgi:hypothetical protein